MLGAQSRTHHHGEKSSSLTAEFFATAAPRVLFPCRTRYGISVSRLNSAAMVRAMIA